MLEDRILKSRESKYEIIRMYSANSSVVTLKANVPGENKNLPIAYCLINYFRYPIEKLGSKSMIPLDGEDGPMYVFLFDKGSIKKDTLMDIEELALGRYVDIDLYDGDDSIKRTTPRKCIICDDMAFKCIRLRKHSVDEIIRKMEDDYYRIMRLVVSGLARRAMEEELRLSPKFGLVCENSNGSHIDMDFDLMMRARDRIAPYLSEMFEVSSKSEMGEIFKKVRPIGIKAEEAMLDETGGVNCYKGLIFVLGLAVSALGHLYTKLNPRFDDIFDSVSEISMDIMKDYLGGIDTFGKMAFTTCGMKGARGEAASGLSTTRRIIDEFDLESRKSLLEALMKTISILDDTVLLKRCGSYDKYINVKRKFENLKYDESVINALSEECICENLSFGGSADVLVTAIFLRNFKKPLNYLKRIYY